MASPCQKGRQRVFTLAPTPRFFKILAADIMPEAVDDQPPHQ